jgi:magnesium transporter
MKIPKSNIFQLMKSRAGAPPGTLDQTFVQTTINTTVRLISFRDEFYQSADISTLDELPAKIRPDATNWIQFAGFKDVSKLEEIGKMFQINQLVIEDVLNTEHLPKMEEIDGHLFLILKLIEKNNDTDEFEVNHICFVMGDHYIISFLQRDTALFDPFIERIRQAVGKIRQRSNDYILYRLMDIIVDHYYLLFNKTDDKLLGMEEILMNDQSADMTAEVQSQKKELNFLRRNILPVSDALRLLLKSENPLIKKQNLNFFNDISDHLNHLTNAAEHYRDMITGLMELQMMNNSNRMNSVMKSLTIIATIFIPLTFLAGIYGMNFEYMPELAYEWAYPVLMLLMLVIGLGMYFYMRSKKWF